MQFQSDILNINIKRPVVSESTALGAAFMSGLSSGFYKNLDEITKSLQIDRTFTPKISHDTREKLYSNWKKAVSATRLFK